MTGRLAGIARSARPKAPMEALAEGWVTPEHGLAGDARGKPGRRQLVLLSAEDWAAAQAELGGEPPAWTLRRANLLLAAMALPRAADGRLRIGLALVEITGECDPCQVMDLQRPGLRGASPPTGAAAVPPG